MVRVSIDRWQTLVENFVYKMWNMPLAENFEPLNFDDDYDDDDGNYNPEEEKPSEEPTLNLLLIDPRHPNLAYCECRDEKGNRIFQWESVRVVRSLYKDDNDNNLVNPCDIMSRAKRYL